MKTLKKIVVLGFFLIGIIYELILKLIKLINMKTTSKVIGVGLLFLAIGLTFLACSSTKDVYIDAVDVEDEITIEKSGAQLWGETCSRCHLAPSPSSYNDTDWNTIGLHMRIRANLTESDSYKITDFLMSAN